MIFKCDRLIPNTRKPVTFTVEAESAPLASIAADELCYAAGHELGFYPDGTKKHPQHKTKPEPWAARAIKQYDLGGK